ncbi:hypothetical protein TNCT6_72850 [Streptomyces sp. 6-11-2]|nr:hypothetical protein TNCT6_72850 [Streptomyces sp. 6-11-2]
MLLAGGGFSCPEALTDSLVNGASTPIFGIEIRVGSERGNDLPALAPDLMPVLVWVPGSVVEPALGSVVEPALGSIVEPVLGSVVEPVLVPVVEPVLVPVSTLGSGDMGAREVTAAGRFVCVGCATGAATREL